jgi:hypothetical protein
MSVVKSAAEQDRAPARAGSSSDDDGWEIVSRQTNEPIWLLSILFQIVFLIAEMPRSFSTVTWTVRQTATGVIRKVTARSEQEARDKISLELFDAE